MVINILVVFLILIGMYLLWLCGGVGEDFNTPTKQKNYCECGKEVRGGRPYRCRDCDEIYEPNDKLTGIY